MASGELALSKLLAIVSWILYFMGDCPIPRRSCDLAELINVSKVARTSVFPTSLIALVKQGKTHSVAGLITFTDCRRYGDYECLSTTEQFHEHSGITHDANPQNVVVLTLQKCCGLATAPIILGDGDLSTAGGIISKSFLTAQGYEKAMCLCVSVEGVQISMRQLVRGLGKLKTYVLSDSAWQRIFHSRQGAPIELLTMIGNTKHLGCDHEILPARKMPSSDDRHGCSQTADANFECEVSDHDDDCEESDHDAAIAPAYTFSSTIAAMRLGNLLRNSAHIKEAVSAALLLATTDNEHAEASTYALNSCH
jgi:hypothetical protein